MCVTNKFNACFSIKIKQSFDTKHLVETSVWYFHSAEMREEVKREREEDERRKQKYKEEAQ